MEPPERESIEVSPELPNTINFSEVIPNESE